MRILIFSSFFPPEIGAAPNRIWEHARQWARAGCEIIVITNVPNSPFGKVFPGYRNRFWQSETTEGIQVIRVLTFVAGKHSPVARRALGFCVSLVMSSVVGFWVPRADVVVATAPYFTGIPGFLCSFLRGIPMIYEMRDPWLQVASPNGVKGKPGFPFRSLARMEAVIARHSKRVVVIGRGMAKFIKEAMKMSAFPDVIYNGIGEATECLDWAKVKPMHLDSTEGRFVVGIIGNLGNQYDFDAILGAAQSLKEANLFFLFVGEGAQKAGLLDKVTALGLHNIAFCPAVPENEVARWYRACDLTVVSMKQGPVFEVYLPVKVFDSLAMGVPVLFGGEGDAKSLIETSKAGKAFQSGDSNQLSEMIAARARSPAIAAAEGERGAAFVRRRFTRSRMAKQYLDIFSHVAGGNKLKKPEGAMNPHD